MQIQGIKRNTIIFMVGLFLMILLFGNGQVNAAPFPSGALIPKLTPSPTFDPVLYQEDNTPITAASTVLVLIVFLALVLVLFRQKKVK